MFSLSIFYEDVQCINKICEYIHSWWGLVGVNIFDGVINGWVMASLGTDPQVMYVHSADTSSASVMIWQGVLEQGGGGNEFPRFILFSRLCDTASSERIRPKLLIPPRDQTKQCWQKNRGNRRSLRPVAVAKFAQPCPGRCENTDRPVKKWFHLTK